MPRSGPARYQASLQDGVVDRDGLYVDDIRVRIGSEALLSHIQSQTVVEADGHSLIEQSTRSGSHLDNPCDRCHQQVDSCPVKRSKTDIELATNHSISTFGGFSTPHQEAQRVVGHDPDDEIVLLPGAHTTSMSERTASSTSPKQQHDLCYKQTSVQHHHEASNRRQGHAQRNLRVDVPVELRQAQLVGEQNEIWKRFVFGSLSPPTHITVEATSDTEHTEDGQQASMMVWHSSSPVDKYNTEQRSSSTDGRSIGATIGQATTRCFTNVHKAISISSSDSDEDDSSVYGDGDF